MSRINLGDIFELKTPKGNAYLHYVYKDSTIGELIRVLPGLFSERPDNVEQLASYEEAFVVYFPLNAAVNRKLVEKVGKLQIENYEKPKFMRSEHIVQNRILGWHIINTDTWQRKLVASLNEDQKKLSPWGIWNDTLLIERLAEGWTPEKWTINISE